MRVGPTLVYSWPNVVNGGPTVNQHYGPTFYVCWGDTSDPLVPGAIFFKAYRKAQFNAILVLCFIVTIFDCVVLHMYVF